MEKQTRILIVEDETDLAAATEAYLRTRNYDVRSTGTLAEARQIGWEQPPDLILLDVLLPDGSGYDLCREIREQTSAPIIFLTCLGQDEAIVRGLRAGGDDYIVKPFSMEVLHARISAHLRRSGIIGSKIELPPLFIDTANSTVRLDERDIPLSPTEFRLLVYLVENRGKELSQNQIYRAVWGAAPETIGSIVRVNISRLRQKLQLDEASCFELSATATHGYIFLRVRYPGRRS